MRPFHAFAMTCLLGLSLAAAPAAAQTGAGGQSGAQGQSGTAGQSGAGAGQSGTAGQPGDTYGSGPARADQRQDAPQKFVEKAAISNMAEIQLGQLAQQRAQDPEVKQFAQMMVDEHTKAQNELQQAARASSYTLPASLDSRHQKTQDKLSNLSGAEFDREYMKAMVKAHKDTARLLEKRVNASGGSSSYGTASGAAGTSGTSGSSGAAGTSGTSTSGSTSGTSGTSGTTTSSGSMTGTESQGAATSIDSWAAQMLPSVQQHLQQAKDLEERIKGASKSDKYDKSDKSDK